VKGQRDWKERGREYLKSREREERRGG